MDIFVDGNESCSSSEAIANSDSVLVHFFHRISCGLRCPRKKCSCSTSDVEGLAGKSAYLTDFWNNGSDGLFQQLDHAEIPRCYFPGYSTEDLSLLSQQAVFQLMD